jgi:hypothetical protein
MNSWVWDSTEVSKKFMEQSKDIFIGATDIGDYITNDILMERNARCISTFHEEVTVLASLGEWLTFALSTGLRVVQFREGEGICIVDEDLSYFKYEINSSSTIVKLYGDVTFVDTWTTAITDKFEPVKNVIEWIYNSDGQSIEVFVAIVFLLKRCIRGSMVRTCQTTTIDSWRVMHQFYC